MVGHVERAPWLPPPGAGTGEKLTAWGRLEAAEASRAPPSSVGRLGQRTRRAVVRGVSRQVTWIASAVSAAAVRSVWPRPGPRRLAWDFCGSGCEGRGAPGCSGVGRRRGSAYRSAGPGDGIGVGVSSGGCGGGGGTACSALQPGLWQGWWPRSKAPGQDRQHEPWANRARRVHPGVQKLVVVVSVGSVSDCGAVVPSPSEWLVLASVASAEPSLRRMRFASAPGSGSSCVSSSSELPCLSESSSSSELWLVARAAWSRAAYGNMPTVVGGCSQ